MSRRPRARRYLIDDLATILRKPTAAPTVEPAEIIAMVLTTTQWQPGRIIEADDPVVDQVLATLEEAGWSVAPRHSGPRQARIIIAAVLTATQWMPGRNIGPDDLVVAQILSSLQQAGLTITPIVSEQR
ncbi:hypothetical protein ACQR10_04460 [Bradyrhizobium sp. HKCCYLRH2060]|uniref:hypothetical protein n=1 Tax=Bradyrhizobium sp. HKCCYLRH2060 TaxID=3420743 RepID=UPI003EBAFDD8